MYDEGDEPGIAEAVRQAVGTGATVPREPAVGSVPERIAHL